MSHSVNSQVLEDLYYTNTGQSVEDLLDKLAKRGLVGEVAVLEKLVETVVEYEFEEKGE